MLYLTAFLTSLIAVFLKIFQQKNVIAHRLVTMVLTSYAIAIFEVASVLIVVKCGWSVVIPLGTGGAIGALSAVLLHDRIFKRQPPI